MSIPASLGHLHGALLPCLGSLPASVHPMGNPSVFPFIKQRDNQAAFFTGVLLGRQQASVNRAGGSAVSIKTGPLCGHGMRLRSEIIA